MELVDAKKAQKTMVLALQRLMPLIKRKLGSACLDMKLGPQRPDLCFISWKTHPTVRAPDSVLRLRRYDLLGKCAIYVEYLHKNSKWDQESVHYITEDSDIAQDSTGIAREAMRFTYVDKPYDISMGQHYSSLKRIATTSQKVARELRSVLASFVSDLGVNPYRKISASSRKLAAIEDFKHLNITPGTSFESLMRTVQDDLGYVFRGKVIEMVAKELRKDKRLKLSNLDLMGGQYRFAGDLSKSVTFGTDSMDKSDFYISYHNAAEANSYKKETYQASPKDSVKMIASKILQGYSRISPS